MRKPNRLEKTMPHMGQFVLAVLNSSRMSQSTFSRKTGWSKSAICGMLKRRNWLSADLLLAGDVLKHNFVRYLDPELREAMVSKTLFEEEVKARRQAEERIKELEEDMLEEKAKYKGALDVIERMKK